MEAFGESFSIVLAVLIRWESLLVLGLFFGIAALMRFIALARPRRKISFALKFKPKPVAAKAPPPEKHEETA